MHGIGRLLFVLCACAMGCWLAVAQDHPEVQTISRQSADAVDLIADWYAASPGAPVVLSLHMLNSRRSAYEPLLPDLRAAGYAVLNVDMRGHGDSAGERDWDAAIADVGDWLAWLRSHAQYSDVGVALLGASIGANVAIISCAEQGICRGAIALSPGLDYRGTKPEYALAEGLADRAALLVAAHGDRGSADSVRQLFASAGGDVTARILPGRAHGTRLFDNDYAAASHTILSWLEEHLPVPSIPLNGKEPICGITDYEYGSRGYILCSSLPIEVKPISTDDCLFEYVDDRDDDGIVCENSG